MTRLIHASQPGLVLAAALLTIVSLQGCPNGPVSNPQAVLAQLTQALQQAPADDSLALAHAALELTQAVGPYAPPVLTSWIKALEQAIIHGADPTITGLIVQYIHDLVEHGANSAAIRTWLISAESQPFLEQLAPHLQDILFSIGHAPTTP